MPSSTNATAQELAAAGKDEAAAQDMKIGTELLKTLEIPAEESQSE
jgi:hypothetical protein